MPKPGTPEWYASVTEDFSDDEKQAMFYGTAARVYRL